MLYDSKCVPFRKRERYAGRWEIAASGAKERRGMNRWLTGVWGSETILWGAATMGT